MNRVRRYQTNRKRSEEVKEKYPVLIGHSVKACKKLYDIGEVADFILRIRRVRRGERRNTKRCITADNLRYLS